MFHIWSSEDDDLTKSFSDLKASLPLCSSQAAFWRTYVSLTKRQNTSFYQKSIPLVHTCSENG